jgi:transposase
VPTPKAEVVKLSEKERRELEKLLSKHQTGQQMALRARIILAASSGQTNTAIAARYKVRYDTVRLWRNRWVKLQDLSLDDLSVEQRLLDAPRSGAPARITADQRCKIEALACEKPDGSNRPITHWSAREIADELIKRKIVDHISPRHAARLLKIH